MTSLDGSRPGSPVHPSTQRWCAWCGPILIVVIGVGFCLIAGMVPPPSPSAGANQIAAFYVEHQSRIRVGLVIAMLGSGLALPFTVVITLQMIRIEGRWAPLALTQLVAGLLTTVVLVFPMLAMAAAAYRPADRAPDTTLALNDVGWLAFVALGTPAIFQTLSIALAVLRDDRESPVFPRWVGFANLWCSVLYAPGVLCICFQTGPFAWNGILAFWIVLVAFSAWVLVMTTVLLRAVASHEYEPAAPVPSAA